MYLELKTGAVIPNNQTLLLLNGQKVVSEINSGVTSLTYNPSITVAPFKIGKTMIKNSAGCSSYSGLV